VWVVRTPWVCCQMLQFGFHGAVPGSSRLGSWFVGLLVVCFPISRSWKGRGIDGHLVGIVEALWGSKSRYEGHDEAGCVAIEPMEDHRWWGRVLQV
jgi:hypothetical protein